LPSYPDQSWVNWFCYSNLIGESIALYGDGQQQRDPLHITDAANLIVQLVIAEQYSIFSDVGGGEKNRITPVEVVEAIQYITGKKFSKVERMELRSDMKKSFVANNSLVQSLWKPTKNITEGLVETLERMKRTL